LSKRLVIGTSGLVLLGGADALKLRIRRRGGVASWRFDLSGGGLRGRRGVAARYLGLSQARLRRELESGKTLAQIASSTPGRSVAGLHAAMTTAATTRLAAAVSSGWITSEQERQRLAGLSGCIDALLQRSWVGGCDGRSGLGPFGGH
jgi:hypothetical protein